MEKKYQVGIQKEVLYVIEDAKRKGLPFVTKADILHNLEQRNIELKRPEAQVSQALFHLQKETMYRRPRIKKYYNKEGHKKGWTTYEDEIF